MTPIKVLLWSLYMTLVWIVHGFPLDIPTNNAWRCSYRVDYGFDFQRKTITTLTALSSKTSTKNLSVNTISSRHSQKQEEEEERRRRRRNKIHQRPTTKGYYFKSDQLWLQRIQSFQRKNNNNNDKNDNQYLIWIDLENVRGKTGFEWSHDQALEWIEDWTRYYHLTEHVVVVADHGSISQAFWNPQTQLAIVFAGTAFHKADDVLARFVNMDFLSLKSYNDDENNNNNNNKCHHSVIVTADTELQTRCRRACQQKASYHILSPQKFIDDVEQVAAAMVAQEEKVLEDGANTANSNTTSIATTKLTLQEQLQLGQLDDEIRLRAQILDVQVQLGRGGRRRRMNNVQTNQRKKNNNNNNKMLTNKRRQKLQTKLDHLTSQLMSKGPSILDQVTTPDDSTMINNGNQFAATLTMGENAKTGLQSQQERDLILKRWKLISKQSSRKEQTGDRVILAEQLRRQLMETCLMDILDEDIIIMQSEFELLLSPAKAFVQYFNRQYAQGSSQKMTPITKEPMTMKRITEPSVVSSIRLTTNEMLIEQPDKNPLKGLDQIQMVAISDTHGFEGQLLTDISETDGESQIDDTILPYGHVLLHLGDFAADGSADWQQSAWTSFDTWLAKQPHPIKIVVRGNHDPWNFVFSQSGALYVTEPTTIHVTASLSLGVIPYGSSRKLSASNSLPTKCDILATHVPPLNTLDRTFTGKSAGSGFLNRVVSSMGRHAPRLWLCGHIHEGRGVAKRQFGKQSMTTTTTTVINAANANRGRATHLDHGAVVLRMDKIAARPIELVAMEDKTVAKKIESNEKFYQAKTKNQEGEHERLLLAVDLGLKSGVALFGSQGRLLRYEQFHFEKATLEATVGRLLTEWEQAYQDSHENGSDQVSARVTHLAIEGADGYMLRAWTDAAENLSILRVSPEEWRAELLQQKERSSGANAKAASRLIARQVVEDFGVMSRHSGKFPTDVAEAVCLGLYVSHKLGWLSAEGPVVRRYTNGNIIVPK